MATFGGSGNRVDNFDGKNKSPLVTPQKVRQLLNEVVVSEDKRRNCVEQETEQVAPNGLVDVPCEAVSKEAFFSRVESYSCLKWAGKPSVLSPLRCAKYGWVNIDCDMLKCSCCQAFLCASLQASQDIQKYEGRILELTKLLQTQHEKFCFWPDFPCPDRFWVVPLNEPGVLFSAFMERFKSSCVLELQLPAMKPEHLKTMCVTEEVIGILLQLIEEELRKEGPTKLMSEPLSVQVAACIVALCGWAASPTLNSLSLPVLTCSYCQRKVGLWSFHQIEGMVGGGDADGALSTPSTPVSGQEGRTDRQTPASPTPCRMKLRSQDATRSEQTEASPSPVVVRTRSRDSPSPSEELPSPLLRGKRPVTRSRGQGDATGEVPSSPQRKAKRPRLSSTGSPEAPMHRNVFDPVAQHRDWCPWVSVGKENPHKDPAEPQSPPPDVDDPRPGWKAALELFLSMKKSLTPTGASPSQGLHDKSKRVFKIFRQWQVSSSQ